MKELKINHPAVWVSILLQFVIGFIWYGPLFGDAWMKMSGLDMATIEADPADATDWMVNVISSVTAIYVLAWLITKTNAGSWAKGAGLGLLIGFSFVLLSVLTSNIFGKLPFGLAWITGGFTTVGLGVGGLVLGAWRKYKA